MRKIYILLIMAPYHHRLKRSRYLFRLQNSIFRLRRFGRLGHYLQHVLLYRGEERLLLRFRAGQRGHRFAEHYHFWDCVQVFGKLLI